MTWTSGDPIATPRQAEEFAAWHLRTLGFVDAEVTPASGDGGFDVRSERVLAEVKQLTAVVGRPMLQKLAGARENRSDLVLAFYAADGYSRGAVEYAARMGMALFTYSMLGQVVAINAPARALLAAAPSPARATPPRPSARASARTMFASAKADADQVSPAEAATQLADWLEKALLVVGWVCTVLGVLMLVTIGGSDDPGDTARSALGALGVGVGSLVLCGLIKVVRVRRHRGW